MIIDKPLPLVPIPVAIPRKSSNQLLIIVVIGSVEMLPVMQPISIAHR